MTDFGSCSVEHIVVDNQPVVEQSQSLELAAHTTFRIGGLAKKIVFARTEKDIIAEITKCDRIKEPVLILGGGSNLLISDEGFDGTVIKISNAGITADVSGCGGASVKVAAGQIWDRFVAYSLAQEWIGLEALSGIPGSVGATPIQNVGAYGMEVGEYIASVRTFDRQNNELKTFAYVDCGFSYRNSIFKQYPGRYVILEVIFQFKLGNLSAPIRYQELANSLGVEIGQRVLSSKVRKEVLRLRANKGMVLDESDHDTWSAGSFFTNPILTATQVAKLPALAPRYTVADGTIKTSAAWLIEHAGFGKGYGQGKARLSEKHVLALTNRGDAKAQDVIALAKEIQIGVKDKFDILLQPEVNLIGIDL